MIHSDGRTLASDETVGAEVYVGDQMREACGIFGIFAPALDVARLTFYGLYALQHRGQESAGICTADGVLLRLRTGMGLVSQVFDEDALVTLHGQAAIGHTPPVCSPSKIAAR